MIMGESDSKSNNFKVQNQVRNSFEQQSDMVYETSSKQCRSRTCTNKQL